MIPPWLWLIFGLGMLSASIASFRQSGTWWLGVIALIGSMAAFGTAITRHRSEPQVHKDETSQS